MSKLKVLPSNGKIPIHEYLDYPKDNTEVVFNRPGIYCIGDKCWVEDILFAYPWKEVRSPELIGKIVARKFPKDVFYYQLAYLENKNTKLVSKEQLKKLQEANNIFPTKELSQVVSFNKLYWGRVRFDWEAKSRLRKIRAEYAKISS